MFWLRWATWTATDGDLDGVPDGCDRCWGANDTADADADGFCAVGGDCDDADAEVFPGALERCDGADSDCDGSLPEPEADGDGDGAIPCAGDCDDEDPGAYPDAAEILGNDVDENCNGLASPAPPPEDPESPFAALIPAGCGGCDAQGAGGGVVPAWVLVAAVRRRRRT